MLPHPSPQCGEVEDTLVPEAVVREFTGSREVIIQRGAELGAPQRFPRSPADERSGPVEKAPEGGVFEADAPVSIAYSNDLAASKDKKPAARKKSA